MGIFTINDKVHNYHNIIFVRCMNCVREFRRYLLQQHGTIYKTTRLKMATDHLIDAGIQGGTWIGRVVGVVAAFFLETGREWLAGWAASYCCHFPSRASAEVNCAKLLDHDGHEGESREMSMVTVVVVVVVVVGRGSVDASTVVVLTLDALGAEAGCTGSVPSTVGDAAGAVVVEVSASVLAAAVVVVPEAFAYVSVAVVVLETFAHLVVVVVVVVVVPGTSACDTAVVPEAFAIAGAEIVVPIVVVVPEASAHVVVVVVVVPEASADVVDVVVVVVAVGSAVGDVHLRNHAVSVCVTCHTWVYAVLLLNLAFQPGNDNENWVL